MKKVWLMTTAVVAFAGAAAAQDLTIGGFLEFEAAYGENYDLGEGRSIDNLDYGVDGRLNFDYSNSTKSGLEYGMHFELDLYSSDATGTPYPWDILDGGQSAVSFNDGYVFINSALGNVKMGDTGSAGDATDVIYNVPFVQTGVSGALDIASFEPAEQEQIFYQNAFLGVNFEASVDDDSNWGLGIGYSADVGGVNVALGLSAREEVLAGSLVATAGGLTAGVNYAMEEVGATTEYIATSVAYNMGALTVGTGVETRISHDIVSGEEYESNYFIGASYELADGLTFTAGASNLDSDSANNGSITGGFTGGNSDVWGDLEGRSWVAGASVKVAF